MDFVKALEKALELGVTKEEFMRFWEAEHRTNSKSERGGVKSGSSSQASPDYVSENQETRADPLTHQLQQSQDELKQDLQLELHHLLTQEMEKYEQQMKLLQNMHTQTVDDFRQQVGILCQHVSNTTESQASSLKLYFMQELGLLREDFIKIIEARYVKNGAGPDSSGVSQKQLRMNFPQVGNTQQNVVDFGSAKDDVHVTKLKSTTRINTDTDIQHEKQLEHNISDSGYDCHLDGQEETTFYLDDLERSSGNKQTRENDTHNLRTELYELNSGISILMENSWTNNSSASKQYTGSHVDSSLSRATSVTSMNTECIEATGFYAEAISNQLKQNYSATNSRGTSDRLASDALKNSENKTLKSAMFASKAAFSNNHWAGFTVTDCDKLSDSGTIYLSPFLHSDTKSWKARICVSFSAAKLKICVRISRGERIDDREWPKTFTGTGEILNLNSKNFTQIWELPPVTCQKPSSTGEVSCPADICLKTKRGSYENLTNEELQFRNYSDNNKVTFKWNLKAGKSTTLSKTN